MKSKELFITINNWGDFTSTLKNLNKKEKGDAFELLTKLYFKLSPKYSFYDEVWMLSEVPNVVIEELGIPSHDLGIDLIAKTGKEYHAIQCKYHSDQNQSVTFKEVSTFISLLESNNKFTQGYICSSADITSRNYNKLNTKPINLVLSDSWQELEQEFFENARNYLAKKKVSLEPIKPRDHQKKALSEAVEYFVNEGNSRGKLIFPCGAGKSLTGFWMLQELKSKSTLIAVPSLSLVKQTLDVYLREIVAHKRKVNWLCICSDEGIGQDDDVVFYTENLGVPCQTDPEYIEQWLKENKDEEIIVFTTYQSGRIIAEISKKLNYSFDLAIFDEAHKTVGSDKKLFSHLLFEENISIQKRIYMTATERFYRGSKDDIISMDDFDIYGDTFTQMSFKEAIELGLLTDYKVITIDVKKSEIADFIKQNNLVQLNNKWKKETEARSLASMLALRKAMKQFPIKNAVSFHSTIEKAVRNKELQQHITESYHYDPIDTFTVSGKLPTSKRNVIVQEFARSQKSLITNARCLTEGVDVPNIDCIVFSDPRKSKVDIVQALGRALRKKDGKDWGYVILPVIYDEETHDIDNENFQEILSVIRGLASNDERIVEYFKDKAEKGSAKKTSERQFQLEVFSEFIDELELSNQLQIRLWEKLSRFSWMPFEEAREYVRSLNLLTWKNYTEHFQKGILPKNIPSKPWNTYRNLGWLNIGDFLGSKNQSNIGRNYLSFHDAKFFLTPLKLKSRQDWIQYCLDNGKPDFLPINLHKIYSKCSDWKGLGDLLGNGFISTQNRKYCSYNDALFAVRQYKLKNQKEWFEFTKSGVFPENIPKNPVSVYRDNGWISWGHFLGTQQVSNRKREFLNYEDAEKYIQELKIANYKEWTIFRKTIKPTFIPGNPNVTYKDIGWKGWSKFLGTDNVSNQNKIFLNYKQAHDFIKSKGIKNLREWKNWHKKNKPENIPSNPNIVYKNKGWNGFGNFLGNGNIKSGTEKFATLTETRNYFKSNGIYSSTKWREFKKFNKIPSNIPKDPALCYKNKGWKGWADFLGKEDK